MISAVFDTKRIVVYKIRDLHGKLKPGTYYGEELHRALPPDEMRDQHFLVDHIGRSRMVKRDGKTVKQYFVSFAGWPKSFSSWVDSDDIEDSLKRETKRK